MIKAEWGYRSTELLDGYDKEQEIRVMSYVSEEAYSTLPDGEYMTAVSELKKTTSRNGNEMLKLVLEVIEGQFEGEKINYYSMMTPSRVDDTVNLINSFRSYTKFEKDSGDSVIAEIFEDIKNTEQKIIYSETENGFHKIEVISVFE